MEDTSTPTDLMRRIDEFCNEQKEKRRQERESHKQALNTLLKRKTQQPGKEDKEVFYSQIAQKMEKARDVIQRSMSRASTISAKERQMDLTEKDFVIIKQKMDKIDHRLHDMYKNWHAEYGNATTLEECEEIKNIYKLYLDKYESKYRLLYHLLQQPGMIPTSEGASGITPSLAALDDATTLKQKEWIRSEPREDLPRQYTNIEGRLTPYMPQSEDMKLEPTLHVTPEGSLVDIPTVLEREMMETSLETAYMAFPNTQVKTRSKKMEEPIVLHGTKEMSQAEVLASTRQFFACVSDENQRVSTNVIHRDDVNVSEMPATTIVTTTTVSTPTSPTIVDIAQRGTESPRITLPERTVSCPTVTATCRPQTWMQQLTEGQTTEPRREGDSSNDDLESMEDTVPGDVPDELGHEWRIFHPFDLSGVRFPTDSTPSNQRCLVENDALVELIQTTEYLDDVPTWGHRDYRLYPPLYDDPFYRGRGRGRGRGNRGRREQIQERQTERPTRNSNRGSGWGTTSTSVPQTNRQDDEWSMPLTTERREGAERQHITQTSPLTAPLQQKKGYSLTGVAKIHPKKELLGKYNQLGVGNQMKENQEMLEK